MRRVAWSRFTGRIGKINASLAATRQKMLLILTLYKAFTVDSQEQQRLARDRVIVLIRGRQVQRARPFNPPLTADQVRKLLQKAPSTTKEVGNETDFENEDLNTLHQHNLSSSREDLPQVDTDVGQDINGAPRAESVATQSSCKTVKVTKIRHLRTLFGKLILRKRAAAPGRHVTEAFMASNAGAELVELMKLWHIGKWTLTRRTGFQTFSPAPTKFISLLVTLSVEGCTIVPAHLSRDELDGRLWHAGTTDHGSEASLTSQIYASLPTSAHRMIERLLGELDSHGHEILYAEVMGVAKPRVERMIRRTPSNPGTSLMGNRVLLVLQKRQEPKLDPGSDDEY
ncbi:hypothetical protein KC334_g13085 [Hortaea werneckii]|nr:hypothetical protein KC334_g13085 [Hortaea werneckii]KAI6957512.1 hypothetical protein KC355_g13075 [Hortaea werneckii]